jgi:hypothetical protein
MKPLPLPTPKKIRRDGKWIVSSKNERGKRSRQKLLYVGQLHPNETAELIAKYNAAKSEAVARLTFGEIENLKAARTGQAEKLKNRRIAEFNRHFRQGKSAVCELECHLLEQANSAREMGIYLKAYFNRERITKTDYAFLSPVVRNSLPPWKFLQKCLEIGKKFPRKITRLQDVTFREFLFEQMKAAEKGTTGSTQK